MSRQVEKVYGVTPQSVNELPTIEQRTGSREQGGVRFSKGSGVHAVRILIVDA